MSRLTSHAVKAKTWRKAFTWLAIFLMVADTVSAGHFLSRMRSRCDSPCRVASQVRCRGGLLHRLRSRVRSGSQCSDPCVVTMCPDPCETVVCCEMPCCTEVVSTGCDACGVITEGEIIAEESIVSDGCSSCASSYDGVIGGYDEVIIEESIISEIPEGSIEGVPTPADGGSTTTHGTPHHEASSTDAATPDTSAPDASAPDALLPETSAPETLDPDPTVPGTLDPDTTVPGTTAPDTADPATPAAPESTIPDAGPDDLFPDTNPAPTTPATPDPASGDDLFPANPDAGGDDLFPGAPDADDADDLFPGTDPASPAPGDDAGDDDLFGSTPSPEAIVPTSTETAGDLSFPEGLEGGTAEPSGTDQPEGTDDSLDLFGKTPTAEPTREVGEVKRVVRTWTDNTGSFKTEAQLDSIQDQAVRLLKANGRYCTVPFARLSPTDIAYVNQIAAQMGHTSIRLVSR